MNDDPIVEYLNKLNLRVTRENYISINWCGDYEWDTPLPAELEASLPEVLQMNPEQND
jgi:hypothetical protein